MVTKSKRLLTAALGLGASLVLTSVVGADGWFHRSAPCPCPPGHVVPYQPAPVVTKPGEPAPATPEGTTPPSTPAPTDAPTTMDLSAGLESTAASTPSVSMAGRADQTNRFNLFDTMNAIPRTKAWIGYQRVGSYKTGFNPNNSITDALPSGFEFSSSFTLADLYQDAGINPNIIQRQDTDLYRFGFEYAFSSKASIAFQTQYVTWDIDGTPDAWANPQILFKYVVCQSENTWITAILGLQPQASAKENEITDDTTSWYPGMLFYTGSGDFILQGGFQFRIPVGGNNVYTFDYALSAGYWLYRHPSLTYAGNCGGCCGSGRRAHLLGIIPQIELFGKHVIGDSTIVDAFNYPASFEVDVPSGTGTVPVTFSFPLTYEEPRNVYDLTLGTQVILSHGISLAGGYSFPLTGGSVRSDEWLFSITFGF